MIDKSGLTYKPNSICSDKKENTVYRIVYRSIPGNAQDQGINEAP